MLGMSWELNNIMLKLSFNINQIKFLSIFLFWLCCLSILVINSYSSKKNIETSVFVDTLRQFDVSNDNINKITKLYIADEPNFSTEDLVTVFNDNNYSYETIIQYKKVPNIYISSLPKDFGKITSSNKKKSLFVRSILPLVIKENNKIRSINNKIKLIKNNFKMIGKNDAAWLNKMMDSYKVKSNNIDELLVKVDIVPVSIALGQAAIESGWGTSRFAMEGNALYGQWSWKVGSGIIPKERNENENYEIKSFLSLSNSVSSYMKNLNTHYNYENFRINRSLLREHNLPVLGSYLYKYLNGYATDSNYSETLIKIIEINNFKELENVEIKFVDSNSDLINLT